MTIGSATFVLHTHLPYCRLAGRWPHGEEWLHEATLECYLPLARALRCLASEVKGSLGVTLNITPILAEQLGDPLIKRHFAEYLSGRVERAATDASRFAGVQGLRGATAAFHRDRYEGIRAFYQDEIHGDILGAFAALEAEGRIEIATSAATHGYLPLLDNESAVRFQVETGIASHERNFGRKPRSFWLPECAYEPGLERYLEQAGVDVFFVEEHLVTGGRARGKPLESVVGLYPETHREVPSPMELPQLQGTTFQAYGVGHSNVAAIARNERTGMQVWSAAHGYPGDPAYREFHKKDDTSGLHYWRVTGPEADLGHKAEYDPAIAANVAEGHARHFHGLVRSELDAYRAGTGEAGLVLSAYDTELFGHWWLEGIAWLRETIRALALDPEIELISSGDFVARHPPSKTIELPEGSWGDGGDHRTWMNDATAWTWPEIHRRQRRATHLLRDASPAAKQLARELLLLQSSDWQFLMTTGQAHDYAVERFRSHVQRFDALADAMESRNPALDALVEGYEAMDNPFPGIDPTRYAPPGGPPSTA
jgi:1,4-alpha-glucan branching enzyme